MLFGPTGKPQGTTGGPQGDHTKMAFLRSQQTWIPKTPFCAFAWVLIRLAGFRYLQLLAKQLGALEPDECQFCLAAINPTENNRNILFCIVFTENDRNILFCIVFSKTTQIKQIHKFPICSLNLLGGG